MRGRGMKNKAHAKINLCLNVKGKLEYEFSEWKKKNLQILWIIRL